MRNTITPWSCVLYLYGGRYTVQTTTEGTHNGRRTTKKRCRNPAQHYLE